MICAWIETSSAETGSSATMKSGLSGERAGDADALALAARELVRVARRRVARAGRRSRAARATARPPARRLGEAVRAQRLADDPADAVPRVERRVRVLEDHLHPPAQRPQLASSSVVMSWPSKTMRPPVGS